MTDAFDQLRRPDRPVRPGDDFATRLRERLDGELVRRALRDLPAVGAVSPDTDTIPTTTGAPMPASAYLAVHDARAALEFYATAFGATISDVFEMGDTIGHAAITIAGQEFFLADEFPEVGALSPRTVGGSTVAMLLNLDSGAEVDVLYEQAVAAGATADRPPADQDHGHRTGWLVDPFGHRWSLTAPLAAARPNRRAANGGIWPAINAVDAPAMADFMTDVLGFVEQIRVVDPDDPSVFVHSQYRWPEGGVIQVGTAGRVGNPYSERASGNDSVYVVTDDVVAVYDRCVAAGVEILSAPTEQDYDPGGLMCSFLDPEGNRWSFGTYGGE